MNSPSFVHLRCHSEYSVVDGMVRVGDYVKRGLDDNMPALALTDLSNLFGAIKFYKAARGKGIKPIIGCDFWLETEANREQPFRFLLLCQNHAGYLRLCDWMTRSFTQNQHRGRAEIKRAWLEEGTDGLVLLSGAMAGDVGQALLAGNDSAATKLAKDWSALFPNRFYIELQRVGQEQESLYDAKALQLAAELGLPPVATHPVQFLDPDDFKAHEARVCIAEGYVLADKRRPKLFTEQQYFKTQAEMNTLFADVPEALTNSVEIAKRCTLELTLGKNYLPQFPTPNNESLDDYLRSQALEGLEGRLAVLYPDAAVRESKRPEYVARLDFEAATIIQMGFPGYFLIVADFINWAKHNGVPVGPGRGSGAGSLVAYSLGVTDLDPLQFNLLFERFLNPERVSMPDFDIDFCQEGRDRVIDYVRDKYGREAVAQIATFGTMAAKAVIRDVGRVLDLPFNFVDGIAKLIPRELGITLDDAIKQEEQLRDRREKEEEVKELLELALRLEGLTRNVGTHAGGVLISPGKITDYSPMYCQQGSEATVSQYDKDDVEAVGLVKFDFLGLRTLTILDMAVEWANEQRVAVGEVPIDLATLALDDPDSYKLLRNSNTTAVFQLESSGMKDMLKQAKPDCFEDIIALVALYRPGPMDLIPDFCKRKHGATFEYPHPAVEPVLKETYGIMVYQEQVMQMAQLVGGYSLGGADLLRRAMGKKKQEEMDAQRAVFVEGAQKNGTSAHQAGQLFDLMEKFAGYGFNKSHAAAYALVAYHTAWLKAHYPAAFMAATLSADMNNTDNVQIFFKDTLANGVKVLPPDINRSELRFKPIDEKTILYGLGAVKGTGEAAISVILAAREQDGDFKDLFDFCKRLDLRKVNRRVVESLVRAGAFDGIHPNRAEQLAAVGVAMDVGSQAAGSGQDSLFGESHDTPEQALPVVAAWSEREQLIQEKAALGFYFSGHPFSAWRKDIAIFVKTELATLSPKEQPQMLAGVVMATRTKMTARGKMAFVTIDDGTAQMEVAVGGELWMQQQALLKEDQLLIVEGKVSKDEYTGGLRVNARRLFDLSTARTANAQLLKLSCNGQADAAKLRELLNPYRRAESCKVLLNYHNGQAACEMALPDEWRVELRDELLTGLRGWLGDDGLKILYHS
ncbi:MAG: DNA polymerase III subunit alpha [Methylophilaceae bacterium]